MATTVSTTDPQAAFVTTRWTVVARARAEDSPEAHAALETLCRTYWPPLYAFIRWQGYTPHDAQDLTQSFFTRVLAKGYFAQANPARGRLRTFLLAAVKHFLSNERDRTQTLKRGGQFVHVPIDLDLIESRLAPDLARPSSPDRIFERQWTLRLLDEVLTQLQEEQRTAGNARRFEVLKPTLTAPKGRIPYSQFATELSLSEPAVKVAVHRLRKRYRELLRAEIRQTVESDADVEHELKHLLSVLAD